MQITFTSIVMETLVLLYQHQHDSSGFIFQKKTAKSSSSAIYSDGDLNAVLPFCLVCFSNLFLVLVLVNVLISFFFIYLYVSLSFVPPIDFISQSHFFINKICQKMFHSI